MKVFPLLCASYTSDLLNLLGFWKTDFVFKGDYLEI